MYVCVYVCVLPQVKADDDAQGKVKALEKEKQELKEQLTIAETQVEELRAAKLSSEIAKKAHAKSKEGHDSMIAELQSDNIILQDTVAAYEEAQKKLLEEMAHHRDMYVIIYIYNNTLETTP